MASNTNSNQIGAQHIGSWGKTQSWAVVWFFGALLVGSSLTYFLSNIDFYLYKTNAETLDYEKYRNNRAAFSAVPKEAQDPRALGDMRTAKEGF